VNIFIIQHSLDISERRVSDNLCIWEKRKANQSSFPQVGSGNPSETKNQRKIDARLPMSGMTDIGVDARLQMSGMTMKRSLGLHKGPASTISCGAKSLMAFMSKNCAEFTHANLR
jgi:hypothetical protein